MGELGTEDGTAIQDGFVSESQSFRDPVICDQASSFIRSSDIDPPEVFGPTI